jgi:hypothetical protein
MNRPFIVLFHLNLKVFDVFFKQDYFCLLPLYSPLSIHQFLLYFRAILSCIVFSLVELIDDIAALRVEIFESDISILIEATDEILKVSELVIGVDILLGGALIGGLEDLHDL